MIKYSIVLAQKRKARLRCSKQSTLFCSGSKQRTDKLNFGLCYSNIIFKN